MRTTRFTINAAFKACAVVLNACFTTISKGNLRTIKPVDAGKRSEFIWVAIFLSVCISYNSCGIRYAIAMNQNQKEQPAAPAQNTMEKGNDKTIYFTFDDGPNKGTSNVVSILSQSEIPATFFLVGSHIYGSERQLSTFQDLLCNPFFEAANHTFYHARNRYDQFYKSPHLVLADFQLMRDSVKLNNHLARTPGRNVWRTSEISFDINKRSIQAADLLKANDYTIVGWDVEWKVNAKKQLKNSPEELIHEIDKHFDEHLTKTENHLVVLLHDQHFVDSNNIKALQSLVAQLKNKHQYSFKKVSEYPCL